MSRENNTDFLNRAQDLYESMLIYLRDNLGRFILFIFTFYGFLLIYLGTVAGVYFQNADSNLYFIHELLAWIKGVDCFPAGEDSYTISFYASAEQDYWFFAIIGLAVSVPTMKHPKSDGLRAKIHHFFPRLSETHPYMEYLVTMMNKSSCITEQYKRVVTVTNVDEEFFSSIVSTRFRLKNLHHNHALNHNIGNFSLIPDEKVLEKHPIWGKLSCFVDDEGESVSPPQNLTGEAFKVKDYNIRLEANDTREYHCVYDLMSDLHEKMNMSFIRFTEKFDFCIENRSVTKLIISVYLQKGTGNSNSTVLVDKSVVGINETFNLPESIEMLAINDKVSVQISPCIEES
ncbi:hypothetical protein MHM95_02455 [Pseudoalteromonas sp. CnMc7-15]|uniref:hypothetical protein n=1 Tax=unclassified Pseudoalteromonas TaxID=194690 RepID=UPI001EF5A8A1|nr:hypothetical protein [Pseudoalteromonas sp. CnMc7-15]MCG7565159.1 hypothetical protein [Pseudoalteromonas sp. CnMc7-15]